jgi:hypothetical protein
LSDALPRTKKDIYTYVNIHIWEVN